MSGFSRLYLDYNATAPLAESVLELSAKGSLFGANASSLHTSGKSMRKEISRVTSFIQKTFQLEHNLYYHSGATEALNTVVYSFLEKWIDRKGEFLYLYSPTDHACAYEQAPRVTKFNQVAQELKLDVNGKVDHAWLTQFLKDHAQKYQAILLNLTWVNNETGIIEDIEQFSSLKQYTNLFIHVDAVQSVGKMKTWQNPPSWADFISYSGHKFGAFKSIGFTFYKNQESLTAMMIGGSQQAKLRAGTENVLGILSLEKSLMDIIQNFNYQVMFDFHKTFEQSLQKYKCIEIVGRDVLRAVNCSAIAFKQQKADLTLAQFDLNGIDVSIGSACSSDSIQNSRVLQAMQREDIAQNVIRISFGFKPLNKVDLDKLLSVIGQICT